MMVLRKCSKCGVEKELSPEHFLKTRHVSGTRYRRDCRSCKAATVKAWKAKNREKVLAYNRQYARKRAATLSPEKREMQNAKVRLDRAENPEKHKAYRQKYYRKNKESIRDKCAKWRKKNPDKLREYVRKSSAASREKLNSCYIRTYLTMGTTLKAKDIPQELVEAKRLQLLIARKIKENK